MIFVGHHSLSPQPRPLRRKTSALDGYYKNGIPVTTVQVGDTITYDVPGPYSPGQVYLVQTVNGAQSYNGPFTVPMTPYTLNVNDRPGTYINTIYDKAPSAGGIVIETDSAVLLPAPVSPYTQRSPTSCPQGYVSKSGGCYPPNVAPVVTPTTTKPATTTTRTTTTTGSGGGGGFPGGDGGGGGGAIASKDNTLLIVGLAALAFVILS